MRFKIDDNLKKLAAVKGDRPETVSVELCDKFVKDGLMYDDNAFLGETIVKALAPVYVSDVCSVLAEYLYNDEFHTIPADVFDTFSKLVLWGDGDCPFCGGELEYVDSEGHEIEDGDYFTPNLYIIDSHIYRCVECDKTIKFPNTL